MRGECDRKNMEVHLVVNLIQTVYDLYGEGAFSFPIFLLLFSFGETKLSCNSKAYLLVVGSSVYDVSQEHRQKFGHSIHASSESTVWGTTTGCLTSLAGLVYPLSGYRVYNIEYSQLVCSWCFLEMGVDFLDEDGFGLGQRKMISMLSSKSRELAG